jgi:hypothetical protein
MSLSEHIDDSGNRTEIGELEYQAKYKNYELSEQKLVKIVGDFIINTPFYKKTKFICAIPSSEKEKINLPNKIAQKYPNYII